MTRKEAIDIINSIKYIVKIDDYSDRLEIALDMAVEALKEQRPHGEWIYKGGKYWCSSCGEKAIYHSHVKEPLPHLTNFCPNCGASMMKEGEAE